eukprot:TRINITY_DN75643_c0_g1_i1.p1 TRINITY_DN75643_c0_g1~~TRINITY_DN75643_c0_g1_i1.p1  ORF type:complete len:605 (+),score=91.92 TRINITY_DN75643_c0_g1_i1:89-1903(+)
MPRRTFRAARSTCYLKKALSRARSRSNPPRSEPRPPPLEHNSAEGRGKLQAAASGSPAGALVVAQAGQWAELFSSVESWLRSLRHNELLHSNGYASCLPFAVQDGRRSSTEAKDEETCDWTRFRVNSFQELELRPPDHCRNVISAGHQGSVYEVELQDSCDNWHGYAMKVPQVGGLCIMDIPNDKDDIMLPNALVNQLWICIACPGDDGWLFLCNPAVGDLVLSISGHYLTMSKLVSEDRQKWRFDGESGQLRSKSTASTPSTSEDLCIDVSEGLDENGSPVLAFRAHNSCPVRDNQRWECCQLASEDTCGSGLRLVQIMSCMQGRRALTVRSGAQIRRESTLEVQFLARWSDLPGLVQLQKVVWGWGIPRGIIMERLGKQLGSGTGPRDTDCLLKDLRSGPSSMAEEDANIVSSLSTAAGVARSLLPVAQLLRRLHLDGYTHNDLHDGNILLHPHTGNFKVIDLGSTTRAEYWAEQVGASQNSQWGVTRDWRTFAVAFLGLVSGGEQLSVWDLVGTNGSTVSSSGSPCPWSPPKEEPGIAGATIGIPPEALDLVNFDGFKMAPAEALCLSNVLSALFAPRVDGEAVCSMLNDLGLSRVDGPQP